MSWKEKQQHRDLSLLGEDSGGTMKAYLSVVSVLQQTDTAATLPRSVLDVQHVK